MWRNKLVSDWRTTAYWEMACFSFKHCYCSNKTILNAQVFILKAHYWGKPCRKMFKMRFLLAHTFLSFEEPHELPEECWEHSMRCDQRHLSLHFHFFWSGLGRPLSDRNRTRCVEVFAWSGMSNIALDLNLMCEKNADRSANYICLHTMKLVVTTTTVHL